MFLTRFLYYTSAKNSQGPVALAWCFFASGMGSWTLFSFPEIGVLAGSWGIIGYTLSGCLGMLILAVRRLHFRRWKWCSSRVKKG